MKNVLFLLLFSTSVLAQHSDSLLLPIKNKTLKTAFQTYLDQEQKTIDFLELHANSNQDNSLSISNEENITFYTQAISVYTTLEQARNFLYSHSFYDKKYAEDKAFINKRMQQTEEKINVLYTTRIKKVTTKITNALKPEKADVLPSDVCQRLTESKELLQPTHENCKNFGLSIPEETACFANFLRNSIGKQVQKYIGESDEELNISTMIQFVIDKEGNLIFDKFTRSCGMLKYDLVVYQGFTSFAASTIFCPAKYNDRNVAVFYNLPIRMVLGGY